ncbi:MAG: hypothetical protein AMS24_00300 [Chlamydiae bacterium SM23_39]|nr:MAG: hypothetical protein AMS24_00300 [Chlamydiae bacterium SM23_39]
MKPVNLGNAENGKKIILSKLDLDQEKSSYIKGSDKKYKAEIYVPVGNTGAENYYQLHFDVTAKSKNTALHALSNLAQMIAKMDKEQVDQLYMNDFNVLKEWKNWILGKTKKLTIGKTPIINDILKNIPVVGPYLVENKPVSHDVEVDSKEVVIDGYRSDLNTKINKISSSIDLKEKGLREYFEKTKVEILKRADELNLKLEEKKKNDKKAEKSCQNYIEDIKTIRFNFEKDKQGILGKIEEFEELEKEYLANSKEDRKDDAPDTDNTKKRLIKIEKKVKARIEEYNKKIKQIEDFLFGKKKTGLLSILKSIA